MNLTKNEISRYVLIVFLLAAIPFLFSITTDTILPFFFQLDVFRESLIKFKTPMYWICYLSLNVVTAFHIHVSEKRAGNTRHIIWQLFGLVSGFLGFLGYTLWNIMVQKNLFIQQIESVTSLDKGQK
jgi:hypothetical protein